MSPTFDEGQLQDFYKSEYRAVYCGDTKPTIPNLNEQRARADHLTEFIYTQVRHLNSHLDIGSSAGELLQGVRSTYPALESIGIEPSDEHRAWCQERGFAAFASLQDMRAVTRNRFQLVSLSHVLEHLSDPLGFLSMLRTDVLTEDGYLMIEVPNLFGHVSMEIAHLYCFYEKTLADVLSQSGYEIVCSKIHSIPRNYHQGQRYITVIARPNPQARMLESHVKPVWWRWVQLQRKKGLTGHSWKGIASRVPRKTIAFIHARIGRALLDG